MGGMATDPPLGTRIKRAREQKRWTQQQLAAALGVDRKTVDNWENGRTRPRSAIGALEAVLGVDLTGDTGPSRELTAEEQDAWDALARLGESPERIWDAILSARRQRARPAAG